MVCIVKEKYVEKYERLERDKPSLYRALELLSEFSMDIMDSDPMDYLDEEGQPLPLKDIPKELRKTCVLNYNREKKCFEGYPPGMTEKGRAGDLIINMAKAAGQHAILAKLIENAKERIGKFENDQPPVIFELVKPNKEITT